MNYEMPVELNERLKKKYSDFTLDAIAFKISGSGEDIATIALDRPSLTTAYLELSEEQMLRAFQTFFVHFINTADNLNVPIKLRNVLIYIDPEMIGACQIDYNAKSGVFWNLLLFQTDLPHSVFLFGLFHEVAHSWASFKFETKEDEEIFTDLIAVCVFKELCKSPADVQRADEIIKKYSYIPRSKFNALLHAPSAALKNILSMRQPEGLIHV